MASSINASTAGAGGVITTADNSGVLNIQTAGSTAINVTSSRLVNIGTTTSSGQLTVQAASGQGAALNLLSTDAGGNAQAVFTGNRTYQVGTGNSGSGFSNVLYFYDGTAGAERMRLNSDGNFLVGGTTAGARITATSSANDLYAGYNGATQKFAVSNGGTIYAVSTSISSISDIRYKENIRNLDVGLEKILELKPRLYDWKKGKGLDIKNARGFIAQEFEQVFPDLIDEWKDLAPEGEEPYKSVRQDLMPVLVKAIQELNAKVDTQAAEIAALKAGK
jgi:hypothetical protein